MAATITCVPSRKMAAGPSGTSLGRTAKRKTASNTASANGASTLRIYKNLIISHHLGIGHYFADESC